MTRLTSDKEKKFTKYRLDGSEKQKKTTETDTPSEDKRDTASFTKEEQKIHVSLRHTTAQKDDIVANKKLDISIQSYNRVKKH